MPSLFEIDSQSQLLFAPITLRETMSIMTRPNARRLGGVLVALLTAGQLAAQQAPAVQNSVNVHAGLYEITSSTSDGSVWVAATGSQLSPGARLVALDPVTLAERRVIEMGDAAAFGVAINNRTQTLYTSNTREGTLSAVDLRTGTITTIADPEAEGNAHLFRVVVDEANNMVYSTVAATPGLVWVVDGSTNRLVHKIEGVGARVTGLALDSRTNRLFVASVNDNTVAVVDLATHQVVNVIPTTGEGSTQLAFDPATNRLFVGNQQSNDVSVIDTGTGRVIRKVETGAQPLGLVIHPTAKRLYVATRQGGVLTVIDTENFARIADLEIGSRPNSVHLDPATGRIYVTNKSSSPRPGPGEQPTVDPAGDKVTLIRP